MSRVRGRNRRGTVSIALIVVVFLVIMSIQIFQLKKKETTYSKQRVELEEQIKDEEARAEDIERLATYMQTDEYKEDIAKSKLGLAYDNEIIFKEKRTN